MKTLLHAQWHGKHVTVSSDRFYIQNGFNNRFRINIKVEETCLLPTRFCKGTVHQANQDIIDTLGGLPNYIAKILNDAALCEQKRRARPMHEQLSLF